MLYAITGEMPVDQPTLFEYFWDVEQLKWVPWAYKIPSYIHDPGRKFNEILVPTVDTVRTEWLLKGQVAIKRPVLLVGETGTSKTATTASFLRDLDKEANVSWNGTFVYTLSGECRNSLFLCFVNVVIRGPDFLFCWQATHKQSQSWGLMCSVMHKET